MGLGKWLALGAGYALAPFTGGASIPVGSSIYGAMNANEAANDAQAQQQAGTDRATAANEAAFQPYMNLGGQAANTLAGLSGFTPLAASGGMETASAAVGPRSSAGMPSTGHAVPRTAFPVTPGSERGGIRANTLAELSAPAVAKQQTQSGYVRMRSPDGEERSVPASIVEQMRQAGGTVVA